MSSAFCQCATIHRISSEPFASSFSSEICSSTSREVRKASNLRFFSSEIAGNGNAFRQTERNFQYTSTAAAAQASLKVESDSVSRRSLMAGSVFAGFMAASTLAARAAPAKESPVESSAPVAAADVLSEVTSLAPVAVAAVAGGLVVAGQQGKPKSIDDKAEVKAYFNSTGFDRWRRIYGNTDDVNKVQKDIREGHQVTVDTVLSWLRADPGGLKGLTVCDAGCGVGSLSIPMARDGAIVSASDISAKMVEEAQAKWDAVPAPVGATAPKFFTSDLEELDGKYHTVICLDVLIHYPQDKADEMISHLASCADKRLILSFAPYTVSLAVLKKIGGLFPGPSKATRAYLHKEADIVRILEANGFEIQRTAMTGTKFYFSRSLEAVRRQ